MLYAIAEILDKGKLYGYRILDSNTGEIKECGSQHIVEAINKGVGFKNLEVKNGNVTLLGEVAFHKYTKLNMELEAIDNNDTILILERTSLVDYKCTDYTGRLFSMTLTKLMSQWKRLIPVRGRLKDGEEIVMEETYDIDKERVKYLENKLKDYRAKIAMLGETELGIVIKGHEAVLVSADEDIESCIIPSFVTVIWEKAFTACTRLESIYIPKTIRYIGDEAFCNCNELAEVTMADMEVEVGVRAFDRCSKLKTIRLSNKLKEIPKRMLNYCFRLHSIEIPDSVKIIGESAFEYCEELENVTFNGPLDNIGDCAFNSCINLERIDLPTVKHTGKGIFSLCESLKYIKLSSIDKIGIDMFNSCEYMETIVIPEGVKEICTGAFSYCEELKTVILPSTIERIQLGVFKGIGGTVELVVPKGVTFKMDQVTANIKYV